MKWSIYDFICWIVNADIATEVRKTGSDVRVVWETNITVHFFYFLIRVQFFLE